jgi:hypothetical protein
MRRVLTALGLRAEQRPLVYDLQHWHVRPPDAERLRQEFESALKEASAFCEEREACPTRRHRAARGRASPLDRRRVGEGHCRSVYQLNVRVRRGSVVRTSLRRRKC